jgi:hypothetical protein
VEYRNAANDALSAVVRLIGTKFAEWITAPDGWHDDREDDA